MSRTDGLPTADAALLARLEAAAPGTVAARASDRLSFAHDASHYLLVPDAVVTPKDTAQVAELLRTSAAHGLTLTFRSGGTSLSGQATDDGVLVDTRRDFRGIEILDDAARVRVQPRPDRLPVLWHPVEVQGTDRRPRRDEGARDRRTAVGDRPRSAARRGRRGILHRGTDTPPRGGGDRRGRRGGVRRRHGPAAAARRRVSPPSSSVPPAPRRNSASTRPCWGWPPQPPRTSSGRRSGAAAPSPGTGDCCTPN